MAGMTGRIRELMDCFGRRATDRDVDGTAGFEDDSDLVQSMGKICSLAETVTVGCL
jgi:hypothetical protein